MNIDLDKKEIRKILKEKFGDANFRVFYTESDKLWEKTHEPKISELKTPPEKNSYVLYFDED